jgi:membrane-associated phospholipid phosphatase
MVPLPRRSPLLVLLLLAQGAPVDAQTGGSAVDPAATTDSMEAPVELPPPRPTDLEARAFYAIYDARSPVFERTMRAVNGASLPIFFAVVPALGAPALLTDASEAPVARILLSEASALGLVAAGKFVIQRARPYVALPDVAPRQRRPPGGIDPYSFPSGHSAMAFAVATSASLTYPEWYVIAPAYTWASATALARVWFGMHYPTDIAVGALVGTGAAVLVHVLFASEGDGEEGPGDAAAGPAFTLRVGL